MRTSAPANTGKKNKRTEALPLGKKQRCRTGIGRPQAEDPLLNQQRMKRINNLFEKICSMENLVEADRKARRGKAHSYGVRLHDRNRDENLKKLLESLLAGTFRTSEYSVFTIHEPKERTIHRLPYYPDRIVHHAIMNVMEPVWLSVFTADTYSCIKGRGIHAAAKKLKRVLRKDPEGTRYCLKLDIRKFYPSIDHGVMKAIVRRKVKDKRLLALLDEIIDSAPGVPIGNYLSQYFANLVLAYFDHWMKEEKRVKHYFRYADDMVILGGSKENLHALLPEIRAYLSGLKLEVKGNWQVFPVEARGIDFLGYVFYHTHTRLRKSIKKRMFQKAGVLRRHSPEMAKPHIAAWWGWMKHADCRNLSRKLLNRFEYEIKFN